MNNLNKQYAERFLALRVIWLNMEIHAVNVIMEQINNECELQQYQLDELENTMWGDSDWELREEVRDKIAYMAELEKHQNDLSEKLDRLMQVLLVVSRSLHEIG